MSLERMQHSDRDSYELSSLTDIAAGGAARPVSHVKRLQEAFQGAQPALGYGLTETNAVGCSNFWSNYADRSEEHTSGLQSLMRISYAVFCLKKKTTLKTRHQKRSSTRTNINQLMRKIFTQDKL